MSKKQTANSVKIAVIFLFTGALSLIFSVLYNNTILVIAGLGLTFWGALFFLISPHKLVQASLLESYSTSAYSTIDRIIKDFKYPGKSYYMAPAYPKDVYLSQRLKGLKETILFISETESNTQMPSIEEIADSKFQLTKTKGVLVVPPGIGLVTQLEQASNIDFTKMNLYELCEALPQIIARAIAEDIQLTVTNENQVNLKIRNSLFAGLYSSETNLRSIKFIGCPLTSAIAIIIAKATGNPVSVQKSRISSDGLSVESTYVIVQD